MKNEFRFAVGSPEGRRSTIWKIATWRSDVYVFSRMFGQHSKVSLHESGQCQWSATSEWVKEDPSRKNAERHIVRWQLPAAAAREAQWVFEIRIPESELRTVPRRDERFHKVLWAPLPPKDIATVLYLFLTPPSEIDPTMGASLPGRLLASFRLQNGRWLVLVLTHKTTNPSEVEALRTATIATAQRHAPGFTPSPTHRACAFAEWGPIARGLLELCLVPPPATELRIQR